jgi:molybdenum cofactor cytidylyltransferase
MVLIFGASAMCDPQDVIPAAIRLAGGEVTAVGMPVDPGNLLVLGRLGATPVLGAPGCARSPKENGFDWVLDRLMAGLAVTADDIAGMGVGGLLMEIATRPQPRERTTSRRPPRVHAVILAAGRSSRMGGPNKLLALFDGKPLVRRLAEAALASRVSGVIVVTGHQGDLIAAAVEDLPLRLVDNPGFASGLSTSLRSGIAAVPPEAAGAMVVLADMPALTPHHLDRLIQAFEESGGAAVVRATHDGRRGNPMILPRALFPDLERIEGDSGARQILDQNRVAVVDVEIGEAASLDVDTPEAMAKAGGMVC